MSRELRVNRFTTTAQGLVPAPVTATGAFLKDDATWSPVTVLQIVKTAAELAAAVTLVDLQWQPGDIRRYGALTTAPNNFTAIQAAINQAINGGYPVRIPCGIWNYGTGLSVAGPIQIVGDDMYTAILRKTANVVGMTISDGASPGQASLQGFSLSTAGGDSSVGLSINTVGRPRVRQLAIGGHGSHGIELIQCTAGRFDDISSTFNAGDGMKLTGSGGVQANANTFTNLDLRGNTGWGLNVLSGMNNMGTGIVVQSNTAGGVQMGACFGNLLTVYSESNTGPDISFTAACVAPTFGGNLVNLAFVSSGIVFNGASAAVNVITTIRNGSTLQPGNSQVITDSLVLPSVNTQGAAVTGSFAWTHTINAEADFTINGLAASGITNFKNAAGGANLHIVGVDNLRLNAAAVNSGAGSLALGSTTATTVGVAGGATALPATPLGYLVANLAGNQIKIPYYNN